MQQISIEALIRRVNTGNFRKSSIPDEVASGWP